MILEEAKKNFRCYYINSKHINDKNLILQLIKIYSKFLE